jgi:N-acyl homoserine lactone hydrolase
VRLYLLNFGLYRRRESGLLRSIKGYLIQTDDGENILIDTGYPEDYVLKGVWQERHLEPVESSKEQLMAWQLALAGIQVADLDAVVLTHSDYDHIGGVDALPPSVPIVISEAERALDVPGPSSRRGEPWPSRPLQVIEYVDTHFRPGVELLTTPGHTPGHFSVLVRLANTGPVLLASDAIKVETDESAEQATDREAADASARRVRQVGAEERALIIYGHDGIQWKALRHAPEFYD